MFGRDKTKNQNVLCGELGLTSLLWNESPPAHLFSGLSCFPENFVLTSAIALQPTLGYRYDMKLS